MLEEIHQNDGIIGGKLPKPKKEPFPFEVLKEFEYQEDKIISHLLEQIYIPLEGKNIKKISPQTITRWLKSAGYLTVEYSKEVRKESTMPTEKGREFLVKNLEAIVNGEVVE